MVKESFSVCQGYVGRSRVTSRSLISLVILVAVYRQIFESKERTKRKGRRRRGLVLLVVRQVKKGVTTGARVHQVEVRVGTRGTDSDERLERELVVGPEIGGQRKENGRATRCDGME